MQWDAHVQARGNLYSETFISIEDYQMNMEVITVKIQLHYRIQQINSLLQCILFVLNSRLLMEQLLRVP